VTVRGTGWQQQERCVARPRAEADFLIRDAGDDCRECWGCVRACPARAIRITDGRATIIQDRCVKCGECVSECRHNGNHVRDDLPRVRDLLASGRPVVAVLASEFVAALHPMSAGEIERSLEAAGFFAVESTMIAEEMVAAEYERSFARPCASLTLRSTCPVTVDWVRKFYPQLVTALTPVVPPYVAQARLVKRLYPDDTAVVYVSPCFARKDEAYDPQFAGAVDAAIDFVELERLLADRKPRPPYATISVGGRKPQLLKEISLTDGFPRATIASRDQTDGHVITVRGLHQLDSLLRAVMRGESAPAVVDMLNCEGCIDGPSVRPGLSVFAKRNIEVAERERAPRARVTTREVLDFLPVFDLMRSFEPDPVEMRMPSDTQIDAVLAEADMCSRADVLDCGACGYDTCVEHAIAIIEHNSSWEMCFPFQRRSMREANERLKKSATIDSLTALGNRRAFDERLAEELARVKRYGVAASLLMVDVDGFKLINDSWGHPFGDVVLKTVAEVFQEHLRETDIATRYGGDEFALILPATGKTQAYAVAEKLREAIEDYPFVAPIGGQSVPVTVSIGIASAQSDSAESIEILESADRALYQAKHTGKNQVRLSAG